MTYEAEVRRTTPVELVGCIITHTVRDSGVLEPRDLTDSSDPLHSHLIGDRFIIGDFALNKRLHSSTEHVLSFTSFLSGKGSPRSPG
jgi:hypothetical protein